MKPKIEISKLPYSLLEEWEFTDSISRKANIEDQIVNKIDEFLHKKFPKEMSSRSDGYWYFPDAEEGQVGSLLSSIIENSRNNKKSYFQLVTKKIPVIDDITFDDIFDFTK